MEKIKNYPYEEFGDLNYCYEHEIMYQRKMNGTVSYDKSYFNNYVNLKGSNIANKLNGGRIKLTEKYTNGPILDIGIGSGEFIEKSKLQVYGYDINPYGIEWLNNNQIFIDPWEYPQSILSLFDFTFWDSLEHMQDPGKILKIIPTFCYIFVSIPILNNIENVFNSKHYKPNEHFFYFTKDSFINYMFEYNFKFLEISDFEIQAGREDIYSFVFMKMER